MYSFCNKYNTFKGEGLLLELLEDALIWCPQYIVDLGNLVQLIGSREERIQTETHVGIQQSECHSICLTFGGCRHIQ